MRNRLLAAALAVQVVVPLVATLNGVPSRFGFHMYSGREHLTLIAVDEEGRAVPVDVSTLVANVRYELDWSLVLPALVCAELPSAHRVTVTSGDETATRTC